MYLFSEVFDLKPTSGLMWSTTYRQCVPVERIARLSPCTRGEDGGEGFHTALDLGTALNPHPTLSLTKGEAKRVAQRQKCASRICQTASSLYVQKLGTFVTVFTCTKRLALRARSHPSLGHRPRTLVGLRTSAESAIQRAGS